MSAEARNYVLTSDDIGWIFSSLTLMRQAAIKNKLQFTVEKVEGVMDKLRVDA